MKRKPKEISVARPNRLPDCVTVTHVGDTILTVNGFCAPNARETVEDKLLELVKEALRQSDSQNFQSHKLLE